MLYCTSWCKISSILTCILSVWRPYQSCVINIVWMRVHNSINVNWVQLCKSGLCIKDYILNIQIAITSTKVNLHAWNCVSGSEVWALDCSRYFKLKVLEQFGCCLILILILNLFSKVGPKITFTSFWPPLKWQGVDMHTCLLFLDNIMTLTFPEWSLPSVEALITVAFLILAISNQHI